MDIQLQLTPDELCAFIEACRDALIRRVRWSTDPTASKWRALDYSVAQQSVNLLASAFAKAWMLLRDTIPAPDLDPEFVTMFSLPPEFWNLAADITKADSWSDFPVHDHIEDTSCAICSTLSEA